MPKRGAKRKVGLQAISVAKLPMGCRAKVSAIRTGLTRAQKTEHIKPDEGGATVWDITVLRVAAVAGSKKQFVVRAHRTGTGVILARADIETPVKQRK